MKKYLYIISAVMILFTACVPKKQLVNEQNKVKVLQGDSASTHAKLNDCDSKVLAMEKEKADIQGQLENLSSSSEAAIKSSKMTIAEQAKRLKDLQALIQAQKDIMNKLKQTVANALVNFKPDELSVYMKDGKLYVSLQEKLLFKSGSALVDPKGKEALQKLATVLNTSPDINVMIEGHTDTVPIRGKFEDNWALSVARATSIVRILTDDYQVDAHRVIASGRSKYYPVETNETPEGRARNRRTEIILSPDLTPLFKLLDQ